MRIALPLLIAASSLLSPARAQDPVLVIDAGLHHLGDTDVPSWTEVSAEPEGTRLDLDFETTANTGECTLELRYRDVDNPWYVRINGNEVARLEDTKTYRRRWFVVPAGQLEDGRNRLSVVPSKTTDDIIVGEIRLHRAPLRRVLALQPLQITVRDSAGQPLPSRVTIAGPRDEVVELFYADAATTAVREGLGYTGNGTFVAELPPGTYDVYATRGMEWGLGHARVTVADTVPAPIVLQIEREVDTPGFIACDSHIHTLTYSGHGNASMEERLVTLAGEGVELAIATDHNHNTDYRPLQREMGLSRHFTSVTGNEVTTDNGHFNAFPLRPEDSVPEHRLTDWVKLIDGIRARGAKVVILNHPRWPKINDSPFSKFGVDRASGERHSGPAFTFDAMELANSTTQATNPLYLFDDWFALLNHGERITAVGTSDSHTVEAPVGQGRTYLRSSTDDPDRIDVDEACRALKAGDASVSLGIFCDLAVDGLPMGSTVAVEARRVGVALRVAAPSWVRPRRALVFVDGTQVAEHAIESHAGSPTDTTLRFAVSTPVHDAHLVCIVLGDRIDGPFWPNMNPYTLAATNPVYLDVDGDGAWRSPRAVAAALLARHGPDPERLGAALADHDDAVAVQALALARADGRSMRDWLESTWTRPAMRDYLEQLPK